MLERYGHSITLLLFNIKDMNTVGECYKCMHPSSKLNEYKCICFQWGLYNNLIGI